MDGLKVHVGCGTVYLDGYVNVDLEKSGAVLATEFPQITAERRTTADAYYAKHIAREREIMLGIDPAAQQIICDKYGDWCALPFDDASVAELWSVQCFEHLSWRETHRAMAEARRVLKPGGILRLDVPDHDTCFDMIRDTIEDAYNHTITLDDALIRINFTKRHILGSRRTGWAFHMGSWRREDLISLCVDWGFEVVGDDPNIHFYPAHCIRFSRTGESRHPEWDEQIEPWKAAWEYAGLPSFGADDYVLEIGPGENPWPRANLYVDIVDRPKCGAKFRLGDVQDLGNIRPVDYVLTSHVLEHVDDPVKAASELSRVAKAGCVVCPSPMKEGLFVAHEQDHRWWIIPAGDTLLFKRIPRGLYANLFNAEISGQQHRMLRYGDPRLDSLSLTARKWWKKCEPMMDVVHHWKGELKVRVID